MAEYTYTIMLDSKVVAMAVPLEEALLFIKAMAEEFYSEADIKFSLIREGDIG